MSQPLTLHIRVVEAKDVPKMDVFGKADPFCILQLTSSRQLVKTKVIKSTYTPFWDETFHFPVKDVVDNILQIVMKDADAGSSDDPISKLNIQISTLEVDKVTDKWYPMIPYPSVKKGGQIRLCIHLAPESSLPFKPGTSSRLASNFMGASSNSSGFISALGLTANADINATTSDAQFVPQQSPLHNFFQPPPNSVAPISQVPPPAPQQQQAYPPQQPLQQPLQQQTYPPQAPPSQQQTYPPQQPPPSQQQQIYPPQNYQQQAYPPQQPYPSQNYQQQTYPPQQPPPQQQTYPPQNYQQPYPPQQAFQPQNYQQQPYPPQNYQQQVYPQQNYQQPYPPGPMSGAIPPQYPPYH